MLARTPLCPRADADHRIKPTQAGSSILKSLNSVGTSAQALGPQVWKQRRTLLQQKQLGRVPKQQPSAVLGSSNTAKTFRSSDSTHFSLRLPCSQPTVQLRPSSRRCAAVLLADRRNRPSRRLGSTIHCCKMGTGKEEEAQQATVLLEYERPVLKRRKSESLETGSKTSQRPLCNLRTRMKAVKAKFSPELVAISMVYFVQGILGLARLAVSYQFKDEFHLDPGTVALLTSIAAAPWVIKPVYGFLSDTVPLFGYRRRSYLVLCGLLGTISWAGLATVAHGPGPAVALMVLGSLGTACSDVVVDSIVVERSRGESQDTAGSLQSLCWASSAVGGVVSAYFSGSLVQSWGPRGVFALTALFPLLVTGAAALIDEQPVGRRRGSGELAPELGEGRAGAGGLAARLPESLRTQVAALAGAVTQHSILLPALFVFLWQATPTADTAMFYFQTNVLHFSPEFLGRVRLVGALASLAGVGIYNYALKEVPLRRMFLWSAVLGTSLGLTQLLLITGANARLGLSNELFVLGDSLVLTVLGQVSFMPVLVLAARICPEGVEATLFATLMSILNGGAFVGSAAGSLLTNALGVTADDFTHLATLVTICTLSSLLPLPLLRLVPGGNAMEQAGEAAAAAAEVEDGRDGGDQKDA